MTELVELNPSVTRPVDASPIYVDMQKLPTERMLVSHWARRPAQGGVRFQNGDTLLARITPCLENRKTGFVDFLQDDEVAIGSTEYIVLRSRSHVPRVLSYFLAVSEQFRTYAIRHMVGTSGRQRVSASDIAGYKINAPILASWNCSAGSRSLSGLISSLRNENRSLSTIRDTLLPHLMSGKLRVKDAEKQVEAVV